MLAEEHQGKGYGKSAVSLSLKEVQAMGATKVRTMCKPENSVAKSCYISLGFQRVGLHDDGDLLFEYSFSGTAS
jgi:RimJ/RimL family protein N-acetyltransferase